MAATKQATKTKTITLKGSSQKVSEFFLYGINSLLYQRGIYPPETFTRKQKYGLTLFESTEKALQDYLTNVLKQLNEWLNEKTVQKVVVVITEVESGEVKERWQFDVECDKTMSHDSQPRKKTDEEINKGIRAVITQITATVTFLPLLDNPCTFNILIYTDKDMDMPEQWEESGPSLIANSQVVKLRSFTTSIHKIDAAVSYKDDGM
ncbi:mitotic spindle assembly checkpoint protein MAD2A-like [Patiria miniata]|uniref:Mitotic spindle assembly checkpoint protein MAD2A n=1 Tax=Patiria miniata TaxID=46514 RepID=A0A914A8X8_PATMI|nr:mitotic spindle assembly checkpoint protein MAD2A-like [Patiria miniata]